MKNIQGLHQTKESQITRVIRPLLFVYSLNPGYIKSQGRKVSSLNEGEDFLFDSYLSLILKSRIFDYLFSMYTGLNNLQTDVHNQFFKF